MPLFHLDAPAHPGCLLLDVHLPGCRVQPGLSAGPVGEAEQPLEVHARTGSIRVAAIVPGAGRSNLLDMRVGPEAQRLDRGDECLAQRRHRVLHGDGDRGERGPPHQLNRGEVRHALSEAPAGYRPGWDFAGVVEAAPEDSGFRPGDRVVGLLPEGAWAQRLTVPPRMVAAIPVGVGFPEAVVMGAAGLTASLALSKRGALAGRRVLVTGATGGVGVLAVQLAARAGAHVTALVRDEARREAHGSSLEG